MKRETAKRSKQRFAPAPVIFFIALPQKGSATLQGHRRRGEQLEQREMLALRSDGFSLCV
jgi:hypothetical protein